MRRLLLAGSAVALAGIATVVLWPEPERAADLPAKLEGEWRFPRDVLPRGVDNLQLLASGAERCSGLGTDSACYVIDDRLGNALEWGSFRVSGDLITFYGRETGADLPGTYRWRVGDGSLRLAKVHDEHRYRARALPGGPLTRAGADQPNPKVPQGWTANRFTSKRYGYSIRYPGAWSPLPATSRLPWEALAFPSSDGVDKLSRDPRGAGLPMVLIAASELPAGTTPSRWTATVDGEIERLQGCSASTSRQLTVAGETATLTVYPYCTKGHNQWATFVRGNQGIQVSWWGETAAHEADAPLFDAILSSFKFSPPG